MEKLIYRFRFCKMSNGITLHVMRTPKNAAVTKHEDITKWHRKTGQHCYVLVGGSCDHHSYIV